VTIILRKRKIGKETIIARRMEYYFYSFIHERERELIYVFNIIFIVD